MNEKIQEKLNFVQREHKIRVLYACEAGSRAWGFESVNSDYDVCFIYVYPREHYVQLNIPGRDTIVISDNEYDIHGWDIRKALNLLLVPNSTLLEWLYSPIIYQDWSNRECLQNVAKLKQKPAVFHYISMAQGQWKRYIAKNELVSYKKYLYTIRPILAAHWVIRNKEFPPVRFRTLMDIAPPFLYQILDDIIRKKQEGLETEECPRIKEADSWIEPELTLVFEKAKEMPKEICNNYDDLNRIFRLEIGD